MGCSSSVASGNHINENENKSGKKPKPAPINITTYNDKKANNAIDHEEAERETMVEIMKEKEVEKITEGCERSDPDGAASSLESHHNSQEEDEILDDFDPTKQPMNRKNISSLKKHATQETLEFVYKNSMSSSPSHMGGNFGLITAGTPNTSKWRAGRRSSGVPPPPRALKDSDFLSRYANGQRRPSNMEEEDEEENAENIEKS